MSDWVEPDSALHELSKRIEGVEAREGHHKESLDRFREGLHGVQAGVAGLSSEITNVRQDVVGLESAITETRQTLDTFIEQYGRDREVSKAQAELSRLTTEWHATFAQRKQTRSLARGLVHTLTAQAVYRNVVNTATVRACSEERLLLEPAYWLAPATMAVAAKFRNEDDQRERARAHACVLDAAKANLFFSLTCSRLGDETEAAAWMDLYLQSLDPHELGQDFLVVLDAIASRELGEQALGYAQQAMARWNRGSSRLSADAYLSPDMRGRTRVEARLLSLRSRIADSQYLALRETCGDQWDELRGGWELATVPARTATYLAQVFPGGIDGVDAAASTGGHVESALERLIDQLEPDEAAMREQMRRLELVIEHGGDLEAANRARESSLASNSAPVALLTLLDQAVFEPHEVRLGEPARRMALRAIWPGLENAARRVVGVAERRLPQHITLTIADWSCTVATDPRQMVKSDSLVHELATHIEQQTQAQSDAVVRRWPHVVAAVVIAAFTGALVVPFMDGVSKWIFVLLTMGIFTWAIWEVLGVPFRKKHVRDQGKRLKVEAVATLAEALRQCEDFFEDWREEIGYMNSLTQWGALHGQD